MSDIVELLRARKATWQDAIAAMELAANEIERLLADKAAISETASYYLHEVERLQAVIQHKRRPKS